MEQLKTQMCDLEMTLSQQTAKHRDDVTARQEELTLKYMSEISTLEDQLKHSQMQVTLYYCYYYYYYYYYSVLLYGV